MISKIGNNDYGIFTLASSLINIFLFDFGLSLAVHKKISTYVVASDIESIQDYVGLFTKIYFVLGMLVLMILTVIYFFIPKIYIGLDQDSIKKFSNVFIIMTVYSSISFMAIPQNGILKAFERFSTLKWMDLTHRILSVVLIVLSLFVGWGLYGVVLGSSFSGILVILIKQFFISKKIGIKLTFNLKFKNEISSILSVSFWGAFIGFSQRFIFTITPSILGAVSSTSQIAVFGIIASLESNFYTVGAVLNGFFITKVTDLIKNKNMKQIEFDMINVGKFILSFVGLFIVGFIIVGYDFIILWVGNFFSKAYLGTILVIIPTFLYLPHTISNDILIANNSIKYQGYIYAIMAIINVILSLVLSPNYGVIGATIAISTAYIIRNILMKILYIKKIEINWINYYLKTYIVILPIIVVLIVIGYYLNSFFMEISIRNLFIKVLVISILYSLIVILIFYRNETIKIIAKLRRRQHV